MAPTTAPYRLASSVCGGSSGPKTVLVFGPRFRLRPASAWFKCLRLRCAQLADLAEPSHQRVGPPHIYFFNSTCLTLPFPIALRSGQTVKSVLIPDSSKGLVTACVPNLTFLHHCINNLAFERRGTCFVFCHTFKKPTPRSIATLVIYYI
jgi:hypothetical protein